MKKSIFLGCILIAALSFTSCENSKNGGDLTINVKVENGADYNKLVDEVSAINYIYTEVYDPYWDYWYYTRQDFYIATGTYKNGGFKLTLPKQIDNRLFNNFDYDIDIPSGVSVSNTNVKTATVDRFKAYKNTEYVDDLFYGYINYTVTNYYEVFVSYIYVDADVKITGSYKYNGPYYDEDYTETEEYDANLKKGWNTVYMIYDVTAKKEVQTFTTKKPKADLKWYFEEETVFYAPEKAKQKDNKPNERGFRSFKLFQ